jgi:hypothetical protein
VTENKSTESFVPIGISTMGQKYEFLANFIAVFDKISLFLNVFIEISDK